MIIKIANKLTEFANHIDAKKLLHVGIPLTGGIAIADGVTEAAFAKPGERGQAFKKGLAKGAVYGATLSVAEHALGHPITNWLKNSKIPGTLAP